MTFSVAFFAARPAWTSSVFRTSPRSTEKATRRCCNGPPQTGRILPTHDLSTMVPAMRLQLERAALCTPLLVPDSLPIAWVIEEILLLDECSIDSDWAAGVAYLPL